MSAAARLQYDRAYAQVSSALCRQSEAEVSTLQGRLAEVTEEARRQEVLGRQVREQLQQELEAAGKLVAQLEETRKR